MTKKDDPITKATQNQLESYRKTDILTANRQTILLMMYDAAIRFLKRAIEATKEHNAEDRSKYVIKTQNIVSEFRATLNFELGGEIAKNLDNLYGFVSTRLTQGNLDNKAEYFEEALQVLTTLQTGWLEAVQTLKTQRTNISG